MAKFDDKKMILKGNAMPPEKCDKTDCEYCVGHKCTVDDYTIGTDSFGFPTCFSYKKMEDCQSGNGSAC